MLYFMHAGRLVLAYVFIVSAWREFHGLYLDGGLAADELLKLSLYQYIVRLGILMRIFGGILSIFNTYLGAFLLLIYQAIVCPILHDLFSSELVQFQQSVKNFLQNAQRFCEQGGVQRKLCDQISKYYVNETMSPDDNEILATCYYDSMVEEQGRQKFCNQINEIERMVISNPLLAPNEMSSFIWSEFNILFMKFIKGFGIVAALVCIIAMKHRFSTKRKTN
ncbi:PREDICTED: uncharacterized protein LOC104766225 [Camelina sativa]|uniref:Uncharacterized protein LOC104766225 n=1 Tax=Camelina sativa TaxID=90675 RepID=A0ABM0XN35_CAMSA|nr:PREDICTED: uncharacterized protein LOC104766225 [Camelina sativa]